MASDAEQEIRDAVVERLRQVCPNARIVHELNVAGQGSNRIDVAAIGPLYLVAVEIKSEKDKLDRLSEQIPAFQRVADRVVVAAHAKHWIARENGPHRRATLPPDLEIDHPLARKHGFVCAWHHPQANRLEWTLNGPDSNTRAIPWDLDGWSTHRPTPPVAPAILEMLWRDELLAECSRHGLPSSSRLTRSEMIYEMAMKMTGREVKQAVCRCLRSRRFAEADLPVSELEAAE